MSDKIILCAACGTKNRVADGRSGTPKCGSCGAALGVTGTHDNLKNVAGNKILWLVGVAVMAVIGYFAVFNQDNSRSKNTHGQQNAPVQSKPVMPAFSAPSVAMSPGLIQRPSSRAVAPLKIKTSPGHDYYVKLVNVGGITEMSFYVRGGQYFETKAPLGTYELRYASGDIWYGDKHLFGPNTVYSKADTTFHFNFDGMSYNGYTVELIRQPGGNLRTSRMSPSNF